MPSGFTTAVLCYKYKIIMVLSHSRKRKFCGYSVIQKLIKKTLCA